MFSLIKKIFFRSHSAQHLSADILIVGIGNIGKQYENTRHNIGFLVADALLKKCEVIRSESVCDADVSLCRLPAGIVAAVAKPRTFVNRSGVAVRQLLERFTLTTANCLVIVDDFHLSLGTVRFRRRGSDGGHNGLKSIIAENGTEFSRLRIGIGPVTDTNTIIEFVLGRFTEQETGTLHTVVDSAADAVNYFCANGIESAMNRYNT